MLLTTVEFKNALEAEDRLASTLGAYVGNWVAVRNHEVVCQAGTLRDLLDQVNPRKVDRILEVTEDPGTSCLF